MENESNNEDYLEDLDKVQCSVESYDDNKETAKYDLDAVIYGLDSQIDLLSSHADKTDYIVAIASGLACSMLDILWCSSLDLNKASEAGSDKIQELVKGAAKKFGCKNSDDLTAAIRFLENRFPVPSDGNTNDFGGGTQHHLRDFEHHPDILGLIFSLLTQFTKKSYGIGKKGNFHGVPVKNQENIGKTVPEKIIRGTFMWFFHLVSDMAGSSGTAAKSGGTGIPGPILSLAREIASLPIIRNIKMNDETISKFLTDLFHGEILTSRDENGNSIKGTGIKFDLRTELGLEIEKTKQAIPVVANECIVRCFYFVRRLATQIREQEPHSLDDLKKLDWDNIRPTKNPTITRMLTIATGVFTTVDIGAAVIQEKTCFFVAVNYTGVGRFRVAISGEISWALQKRDIQKIKDMYQQIIRNAYRKYDDDIYRKVGEDMSQVTDGFGLTEEQVEILYNIECQKTLYDIGTTGNKNIRDLKKEWLEEWKNYITEAFPSFLEQEDASLDWYDKTELMGKISDSNPSGTWYRLVLLEAMLFEPYFTISTETDEKGNTEPSKKYRKLQGPVNAYKSKDGDQYLAAVFAGEYCEYGYINRLRKCYEKCARELNEVQKSTIKAIAIAAPIAIAAIIAAGAMAPAIATMLVGSSYAGLTGAALTNACLAFLGGGAVAAGGAGMAGGTMAIVGGGAVLGIGLGGGVGGAVGAIDIARQENAIVQSAKLLVSVREIFLNDEHDLEYSNSVYEQYVESVSTIEKDLVDLRLKAEGSTGEEKKKLNDEVKQAEKTVDAMKRALRSMKKFNSSFQEGMDHDQQTNGNEEEAEKCDD